MASGSEIRLRGDRSSNTRLACEHDSNGRSGRVLSRSGVLLDLLFFLGSFRTIKDVSTRAKIDEGWLEAVRDVRNT
jgi:hypothetical protein